MKNIFIVFILLIFSTTTIADLTGTEGLAIDLSSAGAGTDFTIAFDPTELLGSRTWGDGSTDTIVWTWDRATGTDPTITFNSGSFLLPALTLTTDLAVAHGGTGVSTLGDGFVLLGNAAGAIQALDVTTDGGIIIGDGTTDPVVLDVGSSTGITILGTIATGVWQGTAIADDYIPNTITIDTATVGTTVTITDNEDTAENNPLVFVAGGDLDGGNLGLESDGTTYYTPSTGKITAIGFVGALTGNADTVTNATLTTALTVDTGTLTLTANAANNSVLTIGAGAVSVSGTNTGDNTDAETGDSATAFFDAGTIEHEWGGLQADVSGYTGLVAITGADTTAEIDSLDELEGQLADVTRIVSEAVMPVASADPDVDAAGELSIDTDGANEPNDVILRSMDGNYTQVAVAQSLKSIQGTVITPNSLADATRDACPIWENNTGMTFTITMIRAWSDTDNTTLNVETVDSDWDNNATVDAIEIATDEVANYSTEETTITGETITAGSLIVLDYDDTDAPGWVKFNIMGFFNSDVD